MILTALSQNVKMIWHKAVRNYFEAFLVRSDLKLRTNEIDGAVRREGTATALDANGHGISMQTEVVEAGESSRQFEWHARENADGLPSQQADLKVRLYDL